MIRLLSTLILLVLTLSSLRSQVELQFSSDTITTPGETLDVDVVVSNFTDIVSMQFSLNWEPSVFSYSSIQNVTDQLAQFTEAGNIGTPPAAQAVDDGELTVSWSLSSTEPASITDGTVLFTLRLFGAGDVCDATKVEISNSPRQIEVIDSDFNDIGLNQSGGDIAIDDGNCDGNMNLDGVGLIVSDMSAPQGSSICIPVTTKNFTDIASLQTGVTWDPGVVTFTGVNDAGLTSVTSNEVNVNNGELILLWVFDTEAITLQDDATLFELCFDVSGSTGSSTVINFENVPTLNIEIANSNAESLDFFVDPGTFTVGSDGGGNMTGVGLIADDLFTNNQPTICVPLTTKNFTNIAAFQSGVSFDPSILSYTGSNPGDLASVNVGDGDKDNGVLRLLWTVDLGSNSVILADGSSLIELCFDVVGTAGQRSEIGFINIPFLPIEVVDENAELVDFFVDDGSVTIGSDPNTDITLMASEHLADTGDTVCVDITVEKFNNIQGMGFTITWDETIASYVDQRNFNLPNLEGSSNFNFVSPDKLRVLWTPPSAQSVPDGTSIFQVCFEAVGDCNEEGSTPIDFVGDINPIEFIDNNTNVLSAQLVPGSITIDSCKGPSVDVLALTNPSCNDDQDGAIAVEFLNVTGSVTCEWTDADGNVISSECNLVGVSGGSYALNAQDEDGVMLTRNLTLTNPDTISADATIQDRTCDTESALSIAISGGTTADGTYGLSWSGGLDAQTSFTGIDAGTYSVTITDDNNCSAEFSYDIQDLSIPVTSVVEPVSNRDANNGSITLSPSDGANLTYSWSNGDTTAAITDLELGDYAVTITNEDDGCESNLTFEIDWGVIFGEGLLTDINETYNGFGVSCNGTSDGVVDGMILGGCNDGPIIITIDGSEVSLPATGLSPGSHELRVEDACGNFEVTSFTIDEPDPISLMSFPHVDCPTDGNSDGSIQLNVVGGTGSYTFTTSIGTASSSGLVSTLPDESFTVIAEDENGCQVMFTDVGFTDDCRIPNVCEGRSIMSPNGDGMNDEFLIGCVASGRNQPNHLAVFDRWGRLVFEADNYDNTWTGLDLDGNQLNEGGYMWVLQIGDVGNREINRGTVTILR